MRAAVEARRRAGLQPPDRQLHFPQPRRQGDRRRDRRRGRPGSSPGRRGPGREEGARRSAPRRAAEPQPELRRHPGARSPSSRMSSTACWKIAEVRLVLEAAADRLPVEQRGRPARGSRAPPGPSSELRMRNWMPASSVASAMAPPSASISLTRCPLPMPPIDGLQDIWPSVSMLWVSSSVLQPSRAAASAASVPAWPPPTTMTSNSVGNCMGVRANDT